MMKLTALRAKVISEDYGGTLEENLNEWLRNRPNEVHGPEARFVQLYELSATSVLVLYTD